MIFHLGAVFHLYPVLDMKEKGFITEVSPYDSRLFLHEVIRESWASDRQIEGCTWHHPLRTPATPLLQIQSQHQRPLSLTIFPRYSPLAQMHVVRR